MRLLEKALTAEGGALKAGDEPVDRGRMSAIVRLGARAGAERWARAVRLQADSAVVERMVGEVVIERELLYMYHKEE